MRSLFSAALCACINLATATRLTIQVAASQALANPSVLPPSTHAVLLGPPGVRYDALIRRDNTLVFSHLPAASYLLEVYSRDFFFSPLRVDVTSTVGEDGKTISAWQTFRGNEWSNKGALFGTAKDDLTIQVRSSNQKDFYQPRGGFSLLSFLKSPMILMGLVSVGMIVGLPYLMENMDPETKAEFGEMQKSGPISGSSGAASQIQNFDLAGWMAGKTSTTDAATSSGGSGGGSSGSGGKKQ